MTYKEIKQKHQEAYNKIMSNCGVFWAFSNEQFKEGIKKIEKAKMINKGEKLVSIGMGGFMPKNKNEKMMIELKEADKQEKKELKEFRELKKEAILYELNNHECFYTGKIDDVVDIFKGIYNKKDIIKVYSENRQVC